MWTATELISAALILLRFTVKADFSDVKVAFYYSPTSAKYELFSLDAVDQIFTRKAFNASKKTVLYIHGYQQNLSSATNILMVEAFIKRRTHNILALDWSAYASGNYITNAVPNLIQIGHILGRTVYFMVNTNPFDMKQLHVVGHSLGAQLAGYLGSWVIALSRGTMKIGRITALDPAKPMFYTKLSFLPTHLSYRDAHMVDVIHSEAGTLGADDATGSVDFWPNGGSGQPGCPYLDGGACSHERSCRYFAESVASLEPKFFAIKCLNIVSFTNTTCKESLPLNNMGIDAQPNSTGNFYLQTNPRAPFSRGFFGTHFTPNTDDREGIEEE